MVHTVLTTVQLCKDNALHDAIQPSVRCRSEVAGSVMHTHDTVQPKCNSIALRAGTYCRQLAGIYGHLQLWLHCQCVWGEISCKPTCAPGWISLCSLASCIPTAHIFPLSFSTFLSADVRSIVIYSLNSVSVCRQPQSRQTTLIGFHQCDDVRLPWLK